MRPVFPPLTPVFTRLTQSSQRWCEGAYIGSRTVEISFVTDLEAGPGSRQNEVTLGGAAETGEVDRWGMRWGRQQRCSALRKSILNSLKCLWLGLQ